MDGSMWFAPAAVAVALACGGAAAQETSLLAGSLDNHEVDERSSAVQLGFAQRMNEVFTVSAEYLNEGHPSRHHRDGLAGQGWLQMAARDTGACFGVGSGPHFLVDTTLRYRQSRQWRTQLSWSRVLTDYHRGADMLLLGLGKAF
ncbi:hypothetical protein [Massilia sp. PWRC2]|uniref:hypothetical protein n=1 Tax=Massilia sp. PWRC2 TaxID=2804626 RepID=UPI003CF3B350